MPKPLLVYHKVGSSESQAEQHEASFSQVEAEKPARNRYKTVGVRAAALLALLVLILGACYVVVLHENKNKYLTSVWAFLPPPPTSSNSNSNSSIHVSSDNDNVVEHHQRGELGSVFWIHLDDAHPQYLYHKPQPRPGESRREYRAHLGALKMDGGILCLHRSSPYWFQPLWVASKDAPNKMPRETHMILGKDSTADSNYRLVLALIYPVAQGVTTASFQSSRIDYTTTTTTNATDILLTSETGGTVAIYMGIGPDPFALVKEAATMGWQLASNTTTTSSHATNNDTTSSGPTIKDGVTNRLPFFARYLGWCTWNAMYKNMTGDKIINAVQAMQQSYQIPIRWIIIDDGWQHTTTDGNRRLLALDSSPIKFGPDENNNNNNNNKEQPLLLSLKETIRRLKATQDQGGCDIQAVLAWHAVAGYWLGLEPKTKSTTTSQKQQHQWQLPNASLFYSHFSTGLIQTANKDESIDLGVGIPDNIMEFFERYYSYMKNVGFDGVKTDDQSIAGQLRPFPTTQDDATYSHRHQVAIGLLDAISHSLKVKFPRNNDQQMHPIIHCMCNAPELIYRIPLLFGQPSPQQLSALPFMRASDDFMPSVPRSHGKMIANLAFNSMLLGHLSTPDWDMFQTNIQDSGDLSGAVQAKLHAMARSISGGPIYISDDPNARIPPNQTLIQAMACNDGMILPCSGAGQPVRSDLLRNPLGKDAPPLRIWNTNGIPNGGPITSGVVGIFQLGNVSSSSGIITANVRPIDVEPFRSMEYNSASFLAFSYNQQAATILADASTPLNVDISPGENLWSDVITMVPIITAPFPDHCLEVVPLGYRRMFNMAGAIVETKNKSHVASTPTKWTVQILVRGCGRVSVLVRLRTLAGEYQTDALSVDVWYTANNGTLAQLPHTTNSPDADGISGLQGDGFDHVSFDLGCSVSGREIPTESWIGLDLLLPL